MPGVSVSSSLRHDCPPFLWSIEMSEPTNMANMFWNLDKISETTAIHSGFRLCPIISHSSMRRTMPVAFIYEIPPVKADFTSVVFVRCRRNIHPPHMVLHYTEQPALQKTDPPSGGSVFYRVPHSADIAVQQNFTAARVGRYSGSDCVGNARSSPSILSMSRWI